MAKKKSRLGKGLGALLGDVKATTRAEPANFTQAQAMSRVQTSSDQENSTNSSVLRNLRIEKLQPGQYQPRVMMDKEALNELAVSIKSQGVLQPLLVRQVATDRYEIIAGERRWRAAQLAHLKEVPVMIRQISNEAAMAVGLIENIQRENLNAMETARGYQRLLDEFGLTHQEISESVGSSRAAVSNILRLTSLHKAVQNMLEGEKLDMGHARALLALEQDEQPEAAHRVVRKGLSVRQAEQLVKTIKARSLSGKASNKTQQASADIQQLEDTLSKRIGAKVAIQHGNKKGKLVIHYHSLDELDGILERIK